MLKILKSSHLSLDKLTNTLEQIADVIAHCAFFIAACYFYPEETDMTSLKYSVWANKMGNHNLTQSPKLHALPPTAEAFEQQILRAHLQTAIWR